MWYFLLVQEHEANIAVASVEARALRAEAQVLSLSQNNTPVKEVVHDSNAAEQVHCGIGLASPGAEPEHYSTPNTEPADEQ